jgi:FLYWCH zinc finger domain
MLKNLGLQSNFSILLYFYFYYHYHFLSITEPSPVLVKSPVAAKSKPAKLPHVDLTSVLQTPSSPMVLLSSLAGGMKIEHRNHHFVYHFKRKGCTFMRCINFATSGCTARVLLHLNRVFEISVEHNHEDAAKSQLVCSKNVCGDVVIFPIKE